LLFVLLGVCRGLIRVTTATAVAEEYSRLGSYSGIASGVYNAGLDAGSMLAPPIGGLMAARIGIPNTFRLAAVALPILYYCVWLLIKARKGDPLGPQTAPATSAE
jgi:dipeptide/tripeptide permease